MELLSLGECAENDPSRRCIHCHDDPIGPANNVLLPKDLLFHSFDENGLLFRECHRWPKTKVSDRRLEVGWSGGE